MEDAQNIENRMNLKSCQSEGHSSNSSCKNDPYRDFSAAIPKSSTELLRKGRRFEDGRSFVRR